MRRFLSEMRRVHFANAVFICLLLVIPRWVSPDAAAPIPVHFVEGAVHGFLELTTMDGSVIASGDMRQTSTGRGIENTTVFHFKDGSRSEESVVFKQEHIFSMQAYHLVQRGPAFPEDIEVSLERSGKYHVKTKDHKGGEEKLLDGTLDLPSDVYNGMIFTITKNLPKGAGKTIHIVAFTPEPRLIQLEISPSGEQNFKTDGSAKTATNYVIHPQLGAWTTLFAKLLGRMPPDGHVWVLKDPVPAFMKFEGPLSMSGPVWRIELTSPR